MFILLENRFPAFLKVNSLKAMIMYLKVSHTATMTHAPSLHFVSLVRISRFAGGGVMTNQSRYAKYASTYAMERVPNLQMNTDSFAAGYQTR